MVMKYEEQGQATKKVFWLTIKLIQNKIVYATPTPSLHPEPLPKMLYATIEMNRKSGLLNGLPWPS